MSTYDDASLVLVPSGYKNGVVFSQKPMDANGQLTFTRASDATRVGPNGYIEKVRTNLLTYSQDFSDSSWSIPTTQTKTTGQTDPNGGTTAVLVQNISDGNGYLAKGLTLTANVPHTASIYIKGASSGSVSIRIDDSTAGPQYDINYTTSWQRFSVTRTPNQTGCNFVIGGYGTWDVGTNIYFAFAQAETGDVMTDYIATTSAAVSVGPVSGTPRLDYLNGECPSLLLEPQRSNLVLYSEQMNLWVNGAASITANQLESPDGAVNADKYDNLTDCSTFVTAANGVYTFSLFVKQGTSASASIDMSDGATGDVATTFTFSTKTFSNTTNSGSWSVATPSYVEYPNGWFRLSLTATKNAGSAIGHKILASGSGYTYVWGAQVEAGAYATSYIPTLGTSVTRVADAASKTSVSALIGQTEGTLFVEVDFKYSTTGDTRIWSIWDAGSSEVVSLWARENTFRYQFYDDAASVNIEDAITATEGVHKLALSYNGTNLKVYMDGAVVIDATMGATANLNCSAVGFAGFWGISTINHKIGVKQALLFKTRLTNAQLAELTTL
jgi:hypothetical protein